MKISVSLNSKSIQNAIDTLERYKSSLADKDRLFCEKLSEIGVRAAMMTLATKGQGDSDRSASFDISFNVEDTVVNCTLSITSEPTVTEDGRVFYPHLAWEFGAGNYFNGMGSKNPYAGKLGMGPGTFPEQTHVPQPGFWYYRDKYGDAVRSYGTQETRPMYNAFVEMLDNIETVAKKVYGGKV